MGRYRKFEEDFWQGAVRLVLETGKPVVRQVAKARREQNGVDAPLSESERAELDRLRKENTELRMQRVRMRSVALWVDKAMGR